MIFYHEKIKRVHLIIILLMPKKTLLLLTFNEIDGSKALYDKIPFNLFDEVYVIDGNSSDGTIEFWKEKGYTKVLSWDIKHTHKKSNIVAFDNFLKWYHTRKQSETFTMRSKDYLINFPRKHIIGYTLTTKVNHVKN